MKPLLALLAIATITLSACPSDTLVIDIYGISDAHLIYPYYIRDTVTSAARVAGRWDIRKCGRMQLPILATAYQVFEVRDGQAQRATPSDTLIGEFITGIVRLLSTYGEE